MQTLAKFRSHFAGNVIGYLALFIALGGTSYGLARGSIDSREIKNNTVRTGDLRNNDVRSRDIRNRTIVGRDHLSNSLGGDQINETRLGRVPLAARAESADNALALGGVPAASFGSKPLAASVDFEESPTGGPVLSVPGFGTLAVTGCDPSASEVDVEFRSAAGQDYWRTTLGLVTPTAHESLSPNEAANDFTLAGDQTGTIHLARTTPAAQAVIEFAFAEVGQGAICRVAALAITSE